MPKARTYWDLELQAFEILLEALDSLNPYWGVRFYGGSGMAVHVWLNNPPEGIVFRTIISPAATKCLRHLGAGKHKTNNFWVRYSFKVNYNSRIYKTFGLVEDTISVSSALDRIAKEKARYG